MVVECFFSSLFPPFSPLLLHLAAACVFYGTYRTPPPPPLPPPPTNKNSVSVLFSFAQRNEKRGRGWKNPDEKFIGLSLLLHLPFGGILFKSPPREWKRIGGRNLDWRKKSGEAFPFLHGGRGST